MLLPATSITLSYELIAGLLIRFSLVLFRFAGAFGTGPRHNADRHVANVLKAGFPKPDGHHGQERFGRQLAAAIVVVEHQQGYQHDEIEDPVDDQKSAREDNTLSQRFGVAVVGAVGPRGGSKKDHGVLEGLFAHKLGAVGSDQKARGDKRDEPDQAGTDNGTHVVYNADS